ncbi:MAG: hypothetical protein KI790_09405 [Cyclobacteriaceae bacterium]|nr:hypothetical protein [Cyclobacteriaceae bacterium HetDA_MAG_MS6]
MLAKKTHKKKNTTKTLLIILGVIIAVLLTINRGVFFDKQSMMIPLNKENTGLAQDNDPSQQPSENSISLAVNSLSKTTQLLLGKLPKLNR